MPDLESTTTPPTCLIEKIRTSDINNGIIAGEFILKNQRDFVMAKNDTLELYQFDSSNLIFQPNGSYCLFAHIYCIATFNIKNQTANVFDDLQEETEGHTLLPLDVNHVKQRLQDTSIPLLERYAWQGSDLILVTSSRGYLDIFAVSLHPITNTPVFLHLNEILIFKKQYHHDYRALGPHLTMHPKSHDIAIAAYQDTIEVWSSSSPTSFYSPQENNPSLLTSKTWSPTFIVWHLFYLQPHPFLNTNYLVGIGYRDVTKQAVIMLFEKTDTETFTHCLPFDLFSYPSLVLAFPLPFCFETFCIVTELYLIVCKVPDIMNGNTSLKRITLPDTCDKMSGYCTIPDCITESFYLISQTGVLYKASLNYSPIKLQSLSILDPHLMYIGKDTIESKPVDILLAYSDRCDWLLLLVGPKFFHSVIVYENISPISFVAPLNEPSSLLLAGNNQLVYVQDKKPFYIQSKSGDEFNDVVALFAYEELLLISFGLQSRLLRLSEGELEDITQFSDIFNDTTTIHFSGVENKYYQINAQKILLLDEEFKQALFWEAPKSTTITHACTSSNFLYVVHTLPSEQFQICQFSLQLELLCHSEPFFESPTCLTCSLTNIYMGTYNASVFVFPIDLTTPTLISLPDLHIPNTLLVLSNNDVWIGCRNGYYHYGSTSKSIGFGPIQLFLMGADVFLLCDDQLYVYREVGLVTINLKCQYLVPFLEGVICVQDSHLIFGKIGSGFSISKIGSFTKPPRRLLVTERCIFAICTAQQSSDIVILDDLYEKKYSLSFKDMIVSCIEWRTSFKSPKILVGTAIFKNGKQSGGQFHVYQFQKNSTYELDPVPWSSSIFPDPIRTIVPFGKLAFVISSGCHIWRQHFDTVSKSIVGQSHFTLPSIVTCFAGNEEKQLLAVGTLRDSVILLKYANDIWEILAFDGYTRYIMDVAWSNTHLVACDLRGVVFALRYNSFSESGTLETLFTFQLGCPLIRCLPLGLNEFVCVSVSGAFFLLRTFTNNELFNSYLHPRHTSNVSYLLYRQIPWTSSNAPTFSIVDIEKLAQDPLIMTELMSKFSRKL